MNHTFKAALLAVAACVWLAAPARADDESAPADEASQPSSEGGTSLGGAGVSNGSADKAPVAAPKPASSGPAAAAACPGTSPTAAVDATPGWLGDLAFDPTNNRWLVVSHLGKINGRLMGNNGQPAGAVFTVNTPELTENWSPLAAFGSGKYLVVWVAHGQGSIYGRFISAAGTLEKQFTIAGAGGTPFLNVGGDRTSSLRYDSASRKFVLVWEYRDPVVRTMLTTIDLNGKQGPLAKIGTAKNGGDWGPSVAVNPNGGEYCVAYDQRNSGKWALSPVDAATLAPGKESVVGVVTTNVDIDYNPGTGKYLLIYDAGYAVGVKARILNSCSAADGGADFLLLPNGGYSSAAANSKSKVYAAIGQNWQDYGNSHGIANSAGAVLARKPLFATGSKNGNYLPVIRANTVDGTFAATSSRDYAMTRFVAQIGCGVAGAHPAAPQDLLTWVLPAPNASGSGSVRLAGTAMPSIKKVEILVNLRKVGEAMLVSGAWAYVLDTAPYKGGINLSALATDAAGATHRYTIRFNVAP